VGDIQVIGLMFYNQVGIVNVTKVVGFGWVD
jgi:hypothetical protein